MVGGLLNKLRNMELFCCAMQAMQLHLMMVEVLATSYMYAFVLFSSDQGVKHYIEKHAYLQLMADAMVQYHSCLVLILSQIK